MLEGDNFVRTIYLYLFAIIGLALVVSGSVKFLDMGLKAFIFTKADEVENFYRYSTFPVNPERIENIAEESFTAEEMVLLKNYLAEYKQWEEEDYLTARKQRDASSNLALILVGLPLYLYHWGIIKKETKEKTKHV